MPACTEVSMFSPSRRLPALMLAVAVGAAAPACASSYYQSRGVYSQPFERRAYDNGRREGIARGRDDARSGREFSYTRSNEYRDADNGYRRQDGNRDEYRRTFRQGFQAGYSEGFNEFARSYPRTTPYPRGARPGIYTSPAADNGYRDGLEAGRKDARNRERFGPERSSRYRSADHNYNRRYGSKDDYKRDYRVAFQRGYQDGFTRGRL
jgi:hypothetical protein